MHIDEMDYDTSLKKIIKEVCRIKQCRYRLIQSDDMIELKLSPKDSDVNETNWMFINDKSGVFSLKEQLFKHVKLRDHA